MGGFMRWSRTLVNILPTSMRQRYEQQGNWAGRSESWQKMVGFFGTIGLVVFLLSAAVLLLFRDRVPPIYRAAIMGGAFLSVFILFFFAYLILYFIADRRTTKANDVLPDVLKMMSANLRAGMTPYQAMRAAATKEFDPLGQEFLAATNKSIGNVSFEDMVMEIPAHFNSAALSRSLKLFTSSLRSGGRIADLLDELALDISERKSLKNEMVTNTKTNGMFIMFTIIVGTPLLLAISIYFVDVVSGLQAVSGGGGGVAGFGLGGLGGEIVISSSFLTAVAYGILFLTGLFACMFMGAMIDGDPKKGMKMSPIVVGASFLVFFISRYAISYFLGSGFM
ncbi:MAG: type II secretion system F family protein [Nanoarchaeota archaeon]